MKSKRVDVEEEQKVKLVNSLDTVKICLRVGLLAKYHQNQDKIECNCPELNRKQSIYNWLTLKSTQFKMAPHSNMSKHKKAKI